MVRKYLIGMINVAHCMTSGMLEIGNINPDRSIDGSSTKITLSIVCCIVCDSVEI